MPYNQLHKARTRRKILTSAKLLFAEKGYQQTSIKSIMAHCDLTHGAFYHHFSNKAELYQQACCSEYVGDESHWIENFLPQQFDRDSILDLKTIINSLGIKRDELKSSHSYMIEKICNSLLKKNNRAVMQTQAYATIALLVGAAIIANASNNDIRERLTNSLENTDQLFALSQPARDEYLWEVS